MSSVPSPPAAGDESGTAADHALRRATAGGTKRPSGRSHPARMSGARTDGRDPQPLAAAVETFVTQQGWGTANAIALLTTRWHEVVGADLAAHVIPESFTDGRLVLRAESTAWATQVRLLVSHLRGVIDREVGHGVVNNITVLGPQAPSWVAGPRRVAGRGPRDTYG